MHLRQKRGGWSTSSTVLDLLINSSAAGVYITGTDGHRVCQTIVKEVEYMVIQCRLIHTILPADLIVPWRSVHLPVNKQEKDYSHFTPVGQFKKETVLKQTNIQQWKGFHWKIKLTLKIISFYFDILFGNFLFSNDNLMIFFYFFLTLYFFRVTDFQFQLFVTILAWRGGVWREGQRRVWLPYLHNNEKFHTSGLSAPEPHSCNMSTPLAYDFACNSQTYVESVSFGCCFFSQRTGLN